MYSVFLHFYIFLPRQIFNLDWARPYNNIIVFISVIVCAVFALLYTDKIYTLVTAIITILTLVFLHFIARVDWIGKASLVFSVLMLGFFPVNGVLTGTGLESAIVNYNPEEFLNIRLLTIPIEDAVYGYAQFLLNLYFLRCFKNVISVLISYLQVENIGYYCLLLFRTILYFTCSCYNLIWRNIFTVVLC
jgi:lycopene cyclase domain-containing protein